MRVKILILSLILLSLSVEVQAQTMNTQFIYSLDNTQSYIDGFQLQIATDSLFTQGVITVPWKVAVTGGNDTSYVTLDRGKTYYHHGRVKNNMETSAWSVTWKVNVGYLPLSPCSPVSPANNSTVR